MTLDFEILWIDDQPEGMHAVEEHLSRRLSRKGFSLKTNWVPKIANLAKFIEEIRQPPFPDLILLDLNMKGGLKGDELAARLRSVIQFTDVLFYSAATAQELRSAICAKNIDGVYCCTRDDVRRTATGLIDSLIRKALDISQMRGITMAKVSDFDKKINQCLLAWHAILNIDQQKDLAHNIIRRMLSSNSSAEKNINDLTENMDFTKLITSFYFTTDHRRRTLEAILKDNVNDGATLHNLETFARFKANVIDPRNDLAHVSETEKDGQTILVADSGEEYNTSRLDEIRRGLQEHSENLDDILSAIQDGIIHPEP